MQGGKSLNDRKLSSSVRTKLLKLAEKILDGDDEVEKKNLLYKMCNGLLPRLNEHTGADGERLNINFDPAFKESKNVIASLPEESNSESSTI